MKKFEEPKLNVEALEVEDVITASITGCVDDCTDDGCLYETTCFGD